MVAGYGWGERAVGCGGWEACGLGKWEGEWVVGVFGGRVKKMGCQRCYPICICHVVFNPSPFLFGGGGSFFDIMQTIC